MNLAVILFLSACDSPDQKLSPQEPAQPAVEPEPLPDPPGSVRLPLGLPDGRHITTHTEVGWKARVSAGDSAKSTAKLQTVTRIDRNADGSPRLTTTFESFAEQGHDYKGRYRYDSAAGKPVPESAPDSVRAWAAILGMGLTTTLTEWGELVSIEGNDALRAVIMESVTGPMSGAKRMSLTRVFTDWHMQQLLEGYAGYFPPDALRPGDTWSANQLVPLPLFKDVTLPVAFTLKRLEQKHGRDIAVVTYVGDLDSDDARLRRLELSGMYHYDLGYQDIVYESGWLYTDMAVAGADFDTRLTYTLTSEIVSTRAAVSPE